MTRKNTIEIMISKVIPFNEVWKSLTETKKQIIYKQMFGYLDINKEKSKGKENA